VAADLAAVDLRRDFLHSRFSGDFLNADLSTFFFGDEEDADAVFFGCCLVGSL
jgi:hypothetical protein